MLGLTHTFYGGNDGSYLRRDCSCGGTCNLGPWGVRRGYGSHVNLNEITLALVALATAHRMDWVDPPSERFTTTWGRIERALETLRAVQTSGDSLKYSHRNFHRAYLTASADNDVTLQNLSRDANDEQTSDDNALAYLNLLVLQGLARDLPVDTPGRQRVLSLCTMVRTDIDLARFALSDKIVMSFSNGSPTGQWDRRAAEGAPILSAMLAAGQISADRFVTIAPSLQPRSTNWPKVGGGSIQIDFTTYHGAIFMPALRAIHGMPVTLDEASGVDFFDRAVKPLVSAQIDYVQARGLNALGSQVMSQKFGGLPLSEASCDHTQALFPGNENVSLGLTETDQRLSRATGPHALIMPLQRWQHLDSGDVDTLFQWMQTYEEGFFHNQSGTDLGWEAAIPWPSTNTTYSWMAVGTRCYTDEGRPYEALNSAYIVLSIFDALSDRPLSSFNPESGKLRAIARYLDNGVALPDEFGNRLAFAEPVNSSVKRDGTVDVLVVRTGEATGEASVVCSTGEGSAVPGQDYVTVNTTLTWPSGETTPRIVTVPLLRNGPVADTKTVTLTLSGAVGAAQIGTPSATLLTIFDVGISEVSPQAGPLSGNTVLVISGCGFGGTVNVTIGQTLATGVTVNVSKTRITCTTPARGSAGTVDVSVGSSTNGSATAAGAFRYMPALAITGVAPNHGQLGGGTTLTIDGAGFEDTVNVTVGQTLASGVTVNVSKTRITCTTPARGSAGT
ncbi:MAG: IPT/TIG domain-containing protein, partial [Candidatus Riflebacteria bacterium]|nr:IPT/TIG domain-containing protein [Candidatus Riflebacteria bacterium]